MQEKKLSILVIRLSAIGDIILTTPILRALSTQTGAEITFLTKRKYAWVLKSNPNIHKIVHYEDGVPVNTVFDYVIDLQKNLRSYLFCTRVNGKRFTFNKMNGRKWLYTTFKYNTLPKEHLVDRYFKSVRYLDVKYDGKGLDYYYEKKNLNHLDLPDHYLVVNCGGTYFTKRIPEDVLNRIIQRSEWPIVLLGGNDVDENVKAFRGDSVYNLIGRTDFETSATIIDGCIKLITSDSALMHVGAAMKKNMEVFWGNTSPLFGMYPLMPGNSNAIVENHEVLSLKCRPCSKLGYHTCPKGHFRCMLDQKV